MIAESTCQNRIDSMHACSNESKKKTCSLSKESTNSLTKVTFASPSQRATRKKPGSNGRIVQKAHKIPLIQRVYLSSNRKMRTIYLRFFVFEIVSKTTDENLKKKDRAKKNAKRTNAYHYTRTQSHIQSDVSRTTAEKKWQQEWKSCVNDILTMKFCGDFNFKLKNREGIANSAIFQMIPIVRMCVLFFFVA